MLRFSFPSLSLNVCCPLMFRAKLRCSYWGLFWVPPAPFHLHHIQADLQHCQNPPSSFFISIFVTIRILFKSSSVSNPISAVFLSFCTILQERNLKSSRCGIAGRAKMGLIHDGGEGDNSGHTDISDLGSWRRCVSLIRNLEIHQISSLENNQGQLRCLYLCHWSPDWHYVMFFKYFTTSN